MFGPIDPPGGSPQQRLFIDGINGTTRTEMYPGVGRLARGNPPEAGPNGFNPGGPIQRPGGGGMQGIIQQLIQHHIAQQQTNPLQKLLEGLQVGQGHQLPMHQGQIPNIPSLDDAQAQAHQFPLTHFNQVHAAQSLARFLAGQHTAGLRRYNGRN